MIRGTLYAISLLTGLQLASASTATADENKEPNAAPPTVLKDVVVTATRSAKDAKDVPDDVHVVTKQEIEQKNVKTTDEALKTVPGIFDRRGKGLMDTLSSIVVRGVPDQKRTLIMMDGIPLNDGYTGGVMWQGHAPGNVERIEVVEGPFSSLYGGSAMGGVVNIITKMPEKREFVVEGGYGSSFKKSEGMSHLKKYYLSYGDKFMDKLSLLLSYGANTTSGYPTDYNVQSKAPTGGITGWSQTTDTAGNDRYLIGDKGDNKWQDDSVTFKTKYDVSETSKISLSLMRNRYHYQYGSPHTLLQDAAGKAVYSYGTVLENSFNGGEGKTSQNICNLGYETQLGPLASKFTVGTVDKTDYWYTTPGTKAATTMAAGPGKISSTPSQMKNADLQFSMPLLTNQILTFGTTASQSQARTRDSNLSNWQDTNSATSTVYRSGGKANNYGIYVQDELPIVDKLNATLGLRQDWWTAFDGYSSNDGSDAQKVNYDSKNATATSPKLALVYRATDTTTLRTSVGQAFRAPTVYELYRSWTSSTGVNYNSNPALTPEKTTSWDLGASQNLWTGAVFSATYFENTMRDLIYLKTVDAKNSNYINAGRATSKGVTTQMDQKLDFGLKLFVNATFINSKMVSNSAAPASEGKRLTYIPDKTYNAGLLGENGSVTYSLIGTYVSKRYGTDTNTDVKNDVFGSYDPYTTVDGKIGYNFNKMATLSLAIDNIADARYFSYYRAPGRSWFTDLTMRF